MKIRLKRFLNKYKSKIFSFIAVFIAIPLFSFNAFAYNVSYPFHHLSLKNIYASAKVNGSYGVINQYTFPQGDDNIYWISNLKQNNVEGFRFNLYADTAESDRFFSFPINNDLYDYYFVGSIYYNKNAVLDSLEVSDVRLSSGNVYNNVMYDQNYYTLSNVSVLPYTSVFARGSTFYGKIDDITADSAISFVEVDFTNSVNFDARLWFNFIVIYVPKETATDVAISNIYTILNDGNGDTSSIVSGNSTASDNLDKVISDYHNVEQQFFDDFNSNQQAISSDIVGWSWGGLVNCANWVGVTLTDYYNNMGDFRQYIIYPLMLGIALFFLGRGSSIIGHLYRKPTTTFTHTESRSTMSNGVRHTNTVTTRNGGVFRK